MSASLRRLCALVAAALCAAPVLAGGPLYIYDPATKTPFTWPAGTVPVHTDRNGLGQLSNELANGMVTFSLDQWNQVPTSTLHSEVTGLLPEDYTAANMDSWLMQWNGGGVHVVYDEDGSIFTALFGFPFGVNGITFIEYVDDDSPAILEATVILNGVQVPGDWVTPEEAAGEFAGIVTHELGHAFGLDHSQTNGQLYFFYELWSGPAGCATPYDGYPGQDDVETMYPFASVGATGRPQSTVDLAEDRAAISELYPAAGWIGSTPTIRGTVRLPGRNGAPYTGANVIARNVANPWADAVSALSGGESQGLAGPDGTYTLRGLTPGASYAVYVDGIVAGAFRTPLRTVLPGPEEYFNGAQESADGERDDRCQYTAAVPAAGSPLTADIAFNRVKGAPTFEAIELPSSSVTELDGDGSSAVGASLYGIFRWTPQGIEQIGGDWRSSQAGISHDGTYITAGLEQEDGTQLAGLWTRETGWTSLGAIPGSSPCDIFLSSGWGVSNNGTVVGLNWLDCVNVTAFQWTSGTGMTSLGYLGPSEELGGSRANRISADASTVVGWDRDVTGFWRGAVWRDGVEETLHQPAVLCCDFDPQFCTVTDVGTATAVSPDGSIIVGEDYATQQVFVDPDSGEEFHYCGGTSWRWTPNGGVQDLGDFVADYSPKAQDVSDDGSVIVGTAFPFDFFLPRRSVLWTEATGFIDFKEFLEAQGTFATDWSLAGVNTVSGDGKTFAGFGASVYDIQGFVVQSPKVVLCHANPAHPENKRTIDVNFPESLGDHLAHGDTIGLCGNGM